MANTKKAKVLLLLFCDFCGKAQDRCDVLIRGRDDVHICSACVAVCVDILAENKALTIEPPPEASNEAKDGKAR